MRFSSLFAVLSALSTVLTAQAAAQDLSGEISLELNQAEPIETGGCRLAVVATNGLERPMNALELEVVIFDKNGLVNRFLSLEFSRISAGKTKVLQFDLAEACNDLSRLHVNDVQNCVPPSVEDVYCPDLLKLSNRSGVAFSD